MIRRLRLKFICVNMLIVTVMMGVIFGLVYHFTQTGLETQSVSMLQSIAAEPFRPNRPGKPPEGRPAPVFHAGAGRGWAPHRRGQRLL